MCGIAGSIGLGRVTSESLLHQTGLMLSAISHRGPNSAGTWIDASLGVAIGHRRLAILELSEAGNQPMESPSRRYVIAFNGEIYNHLVLRKTLTDEGVSPRWQGHSDTETLVACFDAWGVERTIDSCVGMFAISVWDREARVLKLARDRIGEKPLYYGWQGRGEGVTFLFGSELKALKAHPSFSSQIDRGAVSLLMRYGYVPAPYSIYEGIQKLGAGCMLTLPTRSREPRIEQYWSLPSAIHRSKARLFAGRAEDAVNSLEALLISAIGQQMVADVPLGAFLSGGIDSTTVVALMQSQSSRPVKTFTIGFSEKGYNEAAHAKAVAKHLGTEHTELYIEPSRALDVVPKLPAVYCEPFSDSSQIPTVLVSELTRQFVTVSLSGDGGDELFCGYNRYVLTSRLWSRVTHFSPACRRMVARGLRRLSPASWNAILSRMQGFLPANLRQANIGDKLHKAARVLACTTLDDLYLGLVSHWVDPASLVINGQEPVTTHAANASVPDEMSGIERMMALDAMTYLPDDILVKVDRAAMAVSLESRTPFLDHRVVEFAWSLPHDLKLHRNQSKWILKQVLYRHVPKALVERPKMGFAVPIGSWLRGPLRDWAEDLLNESRLRQEGFFYPSAVRQKWVEHISGKSNWQDHLWPVLMFQAWLHNERA